MLFCCCFKMQPNFVVVALVQTVVLMRCIALLTKAIVVRIRFEQRVKLCSNIWCIMAVNTMGKNAEKKIIIEYFSWFSFRSKKVVHKESYYHSCKKSRKINSQDLCSWFKIRKNIRKLGKKFSTIFKHSWEWCCSRFLLTMLLL